MCIMNNTKSNINSNNYWADFWYSKGINIFPLGNGKATYFKWGDYKEDSVTNELHESWKQNGDYSNGIS